MSDEWTVPKPKVDPLTDDDVMRLVEGLAPAGDGVVLVMLDADCCGHALLVVDGGHVDPDDVVAATVRAAFTEPALPPVVVEIALVSYVGGVFEGPVRYRVADVLASSEPAGSLVGDVNALRADVTRVSDN